MADQHPLTQQSGRTVPGVDDTHHVERRSIAFDDWTLVSRVEVDRFCEGCGYNLRAQLVRRDERTELLVCRCSECGRYHAANDSTTAGRAWLQRLATVFVWCWILFLIAAMVLLIVAQMATIFVSTDELIRMDRPRRNNPTAYEQFRNTILAVTAGLSLAWGFLGGFLAVVAIPHWRRWMYLALILSLPMIALGIGCLVERHGGPSSLLEKGIVCLSTFTLLNMMAGLAMVWLGRPLARVLVRSLLSARIRGAMSYLWLSDGKPLPGEKALEATG